MPARIAIRRLALRGLAPRDHPAPAGLEQRLAEAARAFLPDALGDAFANWSGDAVLRMRRLDVDITLGMSFEPRDFAALLARAITAALSRVEAIGALTGEDGFVRYPSRAIWLAALLEALAEGRARDQWWLRDTEGYRFLPAASAICTAALAEPTTGREALATLPPLRRLTVLAALTPIEAERLLAGLAGAVAGSADFATCLVAVADSAADLPDDATPLALFLEAAGRQPSAAGPDLASVARLWVAAAQLFSESPGAAARGGDADAAMLRVMDGLARVAGAAPTFDGARRAVAAASSASDGTRRAVAQAVAVHRRRAADSVAQPLRRYTRFGGLLLLLPNLEWPEIARAIAARPEARPDMARRIAHATLGLCAGRARFRAWLDDIVWRELFDLDVKAPAVALAEHLAAIPADLWEALLPLGSPLTRQRDARFLLPRRDWAGSRVAVRALAGLACATTARFARRLAGFADTSAPFLWSNILAVNAVLERQDGGWSARLSRPPLDVLLSLSRIAEGAVVAPSGARVSLARVTP